MKAKAAEAADVGNEHVPEYTTEKEYEVHDLFEDEDEDDEDTDAEKPAQVQHLTCIYFDSFMTVTTSYV